MWVIVAFLITGILFLTTGQETAMDFLGGYLIELSLSVDNLFVFLSGKTALLLALLMVITMLVIARIILGNPYVKDKQDDENEE